MSLFSQVNEYTPWDDTEQRHKKTLLAFLKNESPGSHVTGSAWVVNHAGDKAVLTFHKKLNKWIQLGGHSEKNEAVQETALREAREESGLASLELLNPGIFDLDVHLIPPNGDTPEHYHYDIRFILRAKDGEKLMISRESKDLKWVSFGEIPPLTGHNPGILRMLAKTQVFI